MAITSTQHVPTVALMPWLAIDLLDFSTSAHFLSARCCPRRSLFSLHKSNRIRVNGLLLAELASIRADRVLSSQHLHIGLGEIRSTRPVFWTLMRSCQQPMWQLFAHESNNETLRIAFLSRHEAETGEAGRSSGQQKVTTPAASFTFPFHDLPRATANLRL